MKYEYFIFIDTEFVSSLTSKQPLQIGLVVYRYVDDHFIKMSQFSTYIMTKRGHRLDRYVKKYTHINEEVLQSFGIRYAEARSQFVHFLLDFPFERTVLIGWDPKNDRTMLNLLLNDKEELMDVRWYDWFDVVAPFKTLWGWPTGQTPSLEKACQSYLLNDFKFHDAYEDAVATSALFYKLVDSFTLEQVMNPQWITTNTLQKVGGK